MLLHQIGKLKELKLLYAGDLAIMKQQGEAIDSDDELLKVLCLFHFNAKLAEIINEYSFIIGNDEALPPIIIQLGGTQGKLATSFIDPAQADLLLEKADSLRKEQFERVKS